MATVARIQGLINPSIKELFDRKRKETGDNVTIAIEKACCAYASLSEDIATKLHSKAIELSTNDATTTAKS